MTRNQKQDIRWFEEEMALCEQAIRDIMNAAPTSAQNDELAGLRANLASHKQTLADLLSRSEPA